MYINYKGAGLRREDHRAFLHLRQRWSGNLVSRPRESTAQGQDPAGLWCAPGPRFQKVKFAHLEKIPDEEREYGKHENYQQ